MPLRSWLFKHLLAAVLCLATAWPAQAQEWELQDEYSRELKVHSDQLVQQLHELVPTISQSRWRRWLQAVRYNMSRTLQTQAAENYVKSHATEVVGWYVLAKMLGNGALPLGVLLTTGSPSLALAAMALYIEVPAVAGILTARKFWDGMKFRLQLRRVSTAKHRQLIREAFGFYLNRDLFEVVRQTTNKHFPEIVQVVQGRGDAFAEGRTAIGVKDLEKIVRGLGPEHRTMQERAYLKHGRTTGVYAMVLLSYVSQIPEASHQLTELMDQRIAETPKSKQSPWFTQSLERIHLLHTEAAKLETELERFREQIQGERMTTFGLPSQRDPGLLKLMIIRQQSALQDVRIKLDRLTVAAAEAELTGKQEWRNFTEQRLSQLNGEYRERAEVAEPLRAMGVEAFAESLAKPTELHALTERMTIHERAALGREPRTLAFRALNQCQIMLHNAKRWLTGRR